MRIDSSHRRWFVATFAVGIVATAVYIPYARVGISGSSAIGITFGVTGYVLMLYAVLLGVRKKFPLWRVGRASTWMRGHIWLGFLSFPLLLFHSGFAANGPLTMVLKLLLIAAIGTGVFGALAQHWLPALMTRSVPLETIYEQIPKIRQQLLAEADQLLSPVLNTSPGPRGDFVWGARPSFARTAEVLEIDDGSREQLHSVYSETIRPFLMDPDRIRNECRDKDHAAALFSGLRDMLPETAHGVLTDLENICEEERQLIRQRTVYHCLHAWLLLHVPLSVALVLLGAIHAVVSLRY
jgi:hypothetical protein